MGCTVRWLRVQELHEPSRGGTLGSQSNGAVFLAIRPVQEGRDVFPSHGTPTAKACQARTPSREAETKTI
jgi:hypothetical protein